MSFLSLVNPKLFTGFSILFSFLLSCNPKQVDSNDKINNPTKTKQVFFLSSPKRDQTIIKGQQIDFELKASKQGIIPDSTLIFLEGNLVKVLGQSIFNSSISIDAKRVGRQNLRIVIYYSDSLSQDLNCPITVFSDLKPASFNYKVLRKLLHDETSYTQGLIYYNQAIYEGSGRNGFSKLRKINAKNGDIIKELKLDNEFFGEGITIFNNKIYQLTYRSKVGFIYNLETFELIRKFDLQTVEGWGLTNDSKNLISSDGSSILYFYDPEYLTQAYQLQVCNNKGLVTNLNELEYVDGFIYANIYGEPVIIKIDSQSGIVVGELNLQSIFPEDIPLDMDHVLNGIAFNNDSKTFFVTGKLWPVMYEINITE